MSNLGKINLQIWAQKYFRKSFDEKLRIHSDFGNLEQTSEFFSRFFCLIRWIEPTLAGEYLVWPGGVPTLNGGTYLS